MTSHLVMRGTMAHPLLPDGLLDPRVPKLYTKLPRAATNWDATEKALWILRASMQRGATALRRQR